ncbi:MAG: hypothetical protein ACRCXX_07235 [Cetobacterium sp.]|uniref:hypothetical protein n=1 Tax=Cetobacterium sp. TaxID=2071632 RepID=UPI003F396642
MKIECRKKFSKMKGLTLGKEYKVIEKNNSLRCYLILDDNLEKIWYGFSFFKEVLEDKNGRS